jgi:eukaryotic-like serine/threonine-protein kinase
MPGKVVGSIAFVAAMAMSLSGCVWLQFHFDARHTGVNTFETIISRDNVAGLHRVWNSHTSSVIEGSPAVFLDLVYTCSDDGKLYAFELVTGRFEWSVNVGCGAYATPALTSSTVYIGASDTMWALDRHTGGVLWKTSVGDNPLAASNFNNSPTTFADGLVFAGNNNNYLYAFDGTTGAVVWKTQAAGTTCSAVDCAQGSINDSPAVDDGRVFASAVNGVLAAYDEHTGAVLWHTNLGTGPTLSAPVIVGNVVYIGGDKLNAVDATTGAVLWQVDLHGTVYSTPVVDNGLVYAGSTNGTVYAIDAATRQVAWSRATGGAITTAGPTLANGVLYIGSEDNNLYALNSDTGAVLWSATVGALNIFHSTPAVINGSVYVGSYNHTISAFRVT